MKGKPHTPSYLALDLGAGSGRAIVGTIRDGRLALDEVHRFANNPVTKDGVMCWDFEDLFGNILEGIRLAAGSYDICGISVDTWGVDFGLIGKDGELLSAPVCYRDGRTEGMAAEVMRSIPRERLYGITGIQQMEINTLFQLYALKKNSPGELAGASKLLFTPDLINYLLTGTACNEYTIASTSQMLDARTREWSGEIIDALGLPHGIMQDVVQPGTRLGRLLPGIARQTGADGAEVFAVGSHDTASAIGAIPMRGAGCAFLSSGTWSLLGVTLNEPVLTPQAMDADFTNEGGVDGKILFMRNITGLWLLQRLMAQWKDAGAEQAYDDLLSACGECEPFRSLVDTDDAAFSNPASMSAAIDNFCRRTSQPVPETPGQYARCVLESLALKYRGVVNELERCTGEKIRRLYIVGGGSRNALLNGFTADALGVEVVTGITEGTAMGNIMQQAIADGQLAGWPQAHEIISASFPMQSYTPQDGTPWGQAAERFRKLTGK